MSGRQSGIRGFTTSRRRAWSEETPDQMSQREYFASNAPGGSYSVGAVAQMTEKGSGKSAGIATSNEGAGRATAKSVGTRMPLSVSFGCFDEHSQAVGLWSGSFCPDSSDDTEELQQDLPLEEEPVNALQQQTGLAIMRASRAAKMLRKKFKSVGRLLPNKLEATVFTPSRQNGIASILGRWGSLKKYSGNFSEISESKSKRVAAFVNLVVIDEPS